MADYNLALQKQPNFALAYNNRGTLFLRKGARQSALDDFNAALKYAPSMYFAHANRGRVLALNKEFDAALADFAEAIRIDANAPLAFTLRCVAYIDMGRFDDAIADCNSVINKVPNAQYAMGRRAEAYMGKGNLDAALKDLNAVLALNPNNVRAHMDRGKTVRAAGATLAQARADYRSAAFALTKVRRAGRRDARRSAQERLNALTAQGPGANTGPQHRPDRRQRRLQERACARQSAARRQADRSRVARRRLPDRVAVHRSHPRTSFFEALRAFAGEAEKADWGGWCIMPAMASRSAASIIWCRSTPGSPPTRMPKPNPWRSSRWLAAVGGERRLRLVILDACRNNPFAPTMQRTMALKLVDKGFLQLSSRRPVSWCVYAAKHGETALDGEGADSPFAAALARDIREPRFEVRNCSTSSATTSGRRPGTRSSPSPTARRRDARISTSWGESSRRLRTATRRRLRNDGPFLIEKFLIENS